MFNVINTCRGPYRGGVGRAGLRRNHISNVPRLGYGQEMALDGLYIFLKRQKKKGPRYTSGHIL
jgi:hypothetical protein